MTWRAWQYALGTSWPRSASLSTGPEHGPEHGPGHGPEHGAAAEVRKPPAAARMWWHRSWREARERRPRGHSRTWRATPIRAPAAPPRPAARGQPGRQAA